MKEPKSGIIFQTPSDLLKIWIFINVLSGPGKAPAPTAIFVNMYFKTQILSSPIFVFDTSITILLQPLALHNRLREVLKLITQSKKRDG